MTRVSETPPVTRTLFLATLFVSLAGFLGYYDGTRFITPPTIVILGLQLAFVFAAIAVLRMLAFQNAATLAPLLIMALWAALTLLWTDDTLISARRWLLVFIPGIGLAILAAADPRPARSFAWFKWFLVAVTFVMLTSSPNAAEIDGALFKESLTVNNTTLKNSSTKDKIEA